MAGAEERFRFLERMLIMTESSGSLASAAARI
jgi:hypothetical protein